MSHTPQNEPRAYERGEISSWEFSRALRRGWWLLVIGALLGAALGWAGSVALGTSYTSTASGVVMTNGDSNATEALAGENLAKSKALTFGSLSDNTSTASAVIDELQLDSTPEALLQRVKSTVPLDTSEVRVSATAGTPQEAQQLADAWVTVLGEQVGELGGEPGPDNVTVEMTKVGEASTPQEPSSTSPTLLVAVGTLLGVLIGLLVAVVRQRFRP